MEVKSAQWNAGYSDGKNGYPPLKPGKEYFDGYYAGRKEFEDGEKVANSEET